MTELLITNVEDVIKEAEQLIKTYKHTYESHQKQEAVNMANSVKGSIIGVVQLLTRITDKSAEDYFREIFPEEWRQNNEFYRVHSKRL